MILDRRAEIGDVEAALHATGNSVCSNSMMIGLALLLEVDPGTDVGQIDDDLAFAVAPALEIDVAHAVRLPCCGLGIGEVGLLGRQPLPVWRAGAAEALCSVMTTLRPSTAALYLRLRLRFKHEPRASPALADAHTLARRFR